MLEGSKIVIKSEYRWKTKRKPPTTNNHRRRRRRQHTRKWKRRRIVTRARWMDRKMVWNNENTLFFAAMVMPEIFDSFILLSGAFICFGIFVFPVLWYVGSIACGWIEEKKKHLRNVLWNAFGGLFLTDRLQSHNIFLLRIYVVFFFSSCCSEIFRKQLACISNASYGQGARTIHRSN